jgi:HEAT repeat protein
MARAEQTKLLVSSGLDRLRPLMRLLRTLPWPAPLQRFTQRGLERLASRIPELAHLLDGKRPRQPTTQVAAPTAELGPLLQQLEARDYQTRSKAAQALSSRPESEASAALIRALRDRSVEVAVAAATSLAVGASAEGRAALLRVLENAEGYYHALTRAAAVHGLGALLEQDSDPAPLFAALRDLDAEVSIAAISALSAFGNGPVVSRLLDVVENADGFFLPITRLAAARALERLPVVDGARLERLAAHESDPSVAAVLARLHDRPRPLH